VGATMNDRTDIYFCPIIGALPMIKDGRVIALANGSPRRSSVLPDLATTEEQGFKDSGYNFWVGLFAPAGTPPEIIARLNAELQKALADPATAEIIVKAGFDITPSSAAELTAFVKTEIVKWAKVVKDSGAKAE